VPVHSISFQFIRYYLPIILIILNLKTVIYLSINCGQRAAIRSRSKSGIIIVQGLERQNHPDQAADSSAGPEQTPSF
jgi:hypothetical protein